MNSHSLLCSLMSFRNPPPPLNTSGLIHSLCVGLQWWIYLCTKTAILNAVIAISASVVERRKQQKPFIMFSHMLLLLLARDSVYAIARYMPSPVHPSVCLSHGWISQRQLKLGSRNLHHRLAP